MSGSVAPFFFTEAHPGTREGFRWRAACGRLREPSDGTLRPACNPMTMKNEFPATGDDGRYYTVVRIPSSVSRGPLDADVSSTGNYSYYLADGTRLNPTDDGRFRTANGALTVTVHFAG